MAGAVGDISVVKDMPLEWLNLTDTTVTDLSALKGKPLKRLIMHRCPVADLTPLEGAPLERLTFDPHRGQRGLQIPHEMKTLRHIGANWGERSQPAAEFWRKYDQKK